MHRRQKWHDCPAALEEKREQQRQYQRDYYYRPDELKKSCSPRPRYKGEKLYKCQNCGELTINRFNCPPCLARMSRGDVEMPVTDCLGYELEVAW